MEVINSIIKDALIHKYAAENAPNVLLTYLL